MYDRDDLGAASLHTYSDGALRDPLVPVLPRHIGRADGMRYRFGSAREPLRNRSNSRQIAFAAREEDGRLKKMAVY
jgi:hypothetical protein